jgi:hypothetical protein
VLDVAGSAAQTIEHARWDSVLAEFVHEGGVRYGALQQKRAELDAYLKDIAAVDQARFDRWERGHQIAYLVNAYNALVIRTVIEHYPIKRSLTPAALIKPANSVWQVPGFFSAIMHPVAGRDLTLDEIEHEWLRRKLQEPRIHFALVCAARSCPPLRKEAYTAEKLEGQLDDQARQFLADPEKNRFDRARGTVTLSEIFKWFGEDFVSFVPLSAYDGKTAERGVIGFAARFLAPEDAAWLRSGKLKLSYTEYDWNLNDAGR